MAQWRAGSDNCGWSGVDRVGQFAVEGVVLRRVALPNHWFQDFVNTRDRIDDFTDVSAEWTSAQAILQTIGLRIHSMPPETHLGMLIAARPVKRRSQRHDKDQQVP